MKDTEPVKQFSVLKKAVYWAFSLALMLLLFEVLASTVLLYRYRSVLTDSPELLGEISPFSSVNLIYKVAGRAGFRTNKFVGYQRYRKETQPDPFLRSDSRLGYSAAPGVFLHTYFMRQGPHSDWRSLKIKVTMNEDGSRWTGNTDQNAKSSVYIFGDSFVFGSGVNDEHTFAYLLQQARPEWRVRLFALGGYSLTQAYLRFEDLKDSITANDIVILGYADFFDTRHVMAPSWLRSIRNWTMKRNPEAQGEDFSLPRVSIADGDRIEISYVQKSCLQNNSYCEDDDPGSVEMTNTTAALINYIAGNTQASVYVLHIDGDADNSVFALTKKTTLVSVLASDFDYFIRDDIEGFDSHPGPYWHYAISRRLLQVLPDM